MLYVLRGRLIAKRINVKGKSMRRAVEICMWLVMHALKEPNDLESITFILLLRMIP